MTSPQGLSDRPDTPLDVLATYSQWEFLPVCSPEPLLVLTIKLVSMDSEGLLPTMVYHHIYSYLTNNVIHLVLSFDFSTSDGVQGYLADVNAIVDRLEHGDLVR
jgi:hypothetical protein